MKNVQVSIDPTGHLCAIAEDTGAVHLPLGMCEGKFRTPLIKPIGSMYGIFTYIYNENQTNVGKYAIHGWYGKVDDEHVQHLQNQRPSNKTSIASWKNGRLRR